RETGFEQYECSSEEEAKEKALNVSDKKYPVYFFESDTSGEKLYEEFFTEEEELDLERFSALGVIKNAERRKKSELNSVIGELEQVFKKDTSKEDVVNTLNKLLPTFQHIETGLNLDQKM